MARRDRKRTQGRARRPNGTPVGVPDNGAAANGQPEELGPLAHATPDAELAEAQLALGRPELADRATEEELEEAERATERLGGRANGPAAGALTTSHSREVETHRPNVFARLLGFVQGSWRELQRVQWPDRRQVMQATGVVIGFVIVAGAFLGVASFAAQKLVNLILYGHG